MRVYAVKRSTVVWSIVRLGLVTLLAALGALFAEPRLFFLLLLLVLLWSWYQTLKSPVRVRIRDDGVVEFRTLVGSFAVGPDQMRQVVQVGRRYWLQYGRGWLYLYGNMEGLQDLLAELRAANPALEVKPFIKGQKKG